MTRISARLYDADGSVIGPITSFSKVDFMEQLNTENSWSMEYDRNGIRASDLIQDEDREVGILLDGLEAFRGVIEEDSWEEVSSTGFLTLAGRGTVGLWEFAKVYPQGGVGVLPAEYAFTNATPGFIIKTLFDAAVARGCLPGWTLSFTETLDSDGQAWTSSLTIAYKAGVSLLEILKGFGVANQADFRANGHILNIYNPRTFLGQQTGVTFRRGLDIKESPRSRQRRRLSTVVLVQGDEGVLVERTDATAVAARGRKEGFISQGGITDSGTLNSVGDMHLLVYSSNRISKQHKLSFDPSITHPIPWIDYLPGNYVNTDLVGVPENYRLISISVSASEGGFVSGEVALNDVFEEREVLLDEALNRLAGGATTGGVSTSPAEPSDEDTTIPGKVVGVAALSTNYQQPSGQRFSQVTATWNALLTNTDTSAFDDFDRYELVWSYDFEPTRSYRYFTTTEAVSFSGLISGQAITLQVRAWDSNSHVGEFSDAYHIVSAEDTTPPPAPSTPVVSNNLGLLRVDWDGLDNGGANMPLDTKHVVVYYSTVNGFDPDQPLDNPVVGGTLAAKGAHNIADLEYGTEYFVKLVAVDYDGNRSDASLQGSGIPQQVVGTDLAGNIIDFRNIRFKDIGNLIPDGSFELAASKDIVNDQALSITVADNPLGVTSAPSPNVLKVEDGSDITPLILVSDINVTPDQKIVHIVSTFAENLNGADKVSIKHRYRMADGSQTLSQIIFWNLSSNTGGAWLLRLASTTTIPANAVTMDVLLVPEIVDGSAGRVYLDQWECRFQTGTALIEDAAITTAKIGNLAVNDAQIGSCSIGKLTAGTLTADLTVSSRIKTANTGARAEMSAAGFEAYNTSGTRTFRASSAGTVEVIGQLSTGTTGNRMVINPTGVSLPQIRMYPVSGTDYAMITAYDSFNVTDTDASIMMRSGIDAGNIYSLLAVSEDRTLLGRYERSEADGLYYQTGGGMQAQDTFVRTGWHEGIGGNYGGFFYADNDNATVGFDDTSDEAAYWVFDRTDGEVYGVGEIGSSNTSQSLFEMGNLDATGGPHTVMNVSYGPTYTGTPRVVTSMFDNPGSSATAYGHVVTARSNTGFSVMTDKNTIGDVASVMWWAWREN